MHTKRRGVRPRGSAGRSRSRILPPTRPATSFLELAESQIAAVTEYWATDEEPSEWRKQGGWAGRS